MSQSDQLPGHQFVPTISAPTEQLPPTHVDSLHRRFLSRPASTDVLSEIMSKLPERPSQLQSISRLQYPCRELACKVACIRKCRIKNLAETRRNLTLAEVVLQMFMCSDMLISYPPLVGSLLDPRCECAWRSHALFVCVCLTTRFCMHVSWDKINPSLI